MDPLSQQPQPVQPPTPPQTPVEPTPVTQPEMAQQPPITPAASPIPITAAPVAGLSATPNQIKTGRKKFKDMTHEEIGKRITLLGKILVGLSFASIALSIASVALITGGLDPSAATDDKITMVLAGIQAVLGLGLIKRNIIAYYAFRVIGILVLISLLFVLASLAFVLPTIIGLSSSTLAEMNGLVVLVMAATLVSLAINGLVYFFWIYGLMLTNQSKARDLFRKQPPAAPQPPVQPVVPNQSQ